MTTPEVLVQFRKSDWRRGKMTPEIMALLLKDADPKAGGGDPVAQHDLCWYHYDETKDLDQAFKWAKLGAAPRNEHDKGYAAAQCMLGLCYMRGWGVRQDGELAVKWLTKAIDQGCFKAKWEITECYRYGIGVPRDKKKAEEMWQKCYDEMMKASKSAI